MVHKTIRPDNISNNQLNIIKQQSHVEAEIHHLTHKVIVRCHLILWPPWPPFSAPWGPGDGSEMS